MIIRSVFSWKNCQIMRRCYDFADFLNFFCSYATTNFNFCVMCDNIFNDSDRVFGFPIHVHTMAKRISVLGSVFDFAPSLQFLLLRSWISKPSLLFWQFFPCGAECSSSCKKIQEFITATQFSIGIFTSLYFFLNGTKFIGSSSFPEQFFLLRSGILTVRKTLENVL